jgi:hypothetical protein
MLSDYSTCINTPGNDEQYCAAYDKCLEKNENNASYCKTWYTEYYNPNWVTGNCNTM